MHWPLAGFVFERLDRSFIVRRISHRFVSHYALGAFMEIEVAMTYDQYFDGTRLFNLNTTRTRCICFLLIWYGYPILAALFAFLTVFLCIFGDRTIGPLVWPFGALAFFVWARLAYGRRIRKLYDQQAANMVGRMILSPTGFRFERKNGTANVDYTWGGIESWLERPEMFLLFPGPLSFVRIPKDKLTNEEQDEVRGWISSSGKALT
jgi:hypothetical protein